ncbi:MAG: hypothetical protein L6437_09685, partial [Kiritimatiellae bacterium]|nr:hypothetical protein [Kiritimatiellia bacterium]
QELHLVHQQQKELTLVVTDVDGKRAISDVHWDASYLLKEYFMSDRYNKGVYSQQPADSEWGFSRAPRAVPVYSFAHGTFSDDLFYLVNSQELESPGFDGPPGGMPSISSAVSLRIDGVPPLNGRRFARRIDRPLVSADVRIGEATFTHRYPEDIPLWFGGNVWLPVTESKYYEGKQRYYCFNMKPGMPGIAYVDGEVKIKEDVRFSAEDPVPLSLGGIICTKASGLDTFYASSDDRVVKFNFEDANQEMNFAGAFPKYSYITFFPSHFGSITIYSLTDGLGYFYDQRGHCRFGFTMKGKEIKAGTVLKYQYLAMTGDRSWTPSNAMSRKIKAFTGLGGKPEYALRLEKGKIVSQEYICRLDGEKEGVAGIFPVKNLPCTLPVVVENLNDKWAAIYYEREKKRCRPVGLLDNAAYVQLGTGAEDPHVFIGHPFTCNNRDVFLNLVQTGEKHWTLEIHNPTDQLVKLEIKKSKWFDLIKTDDFGVTVNAGASCVKEFE